MGSIINDNTVSFLKFDSKSNVLRDSISNTNINWEFNLSEEAKINSEYNKSRRNSLQTKTVYDASYNVYSSFNGLKLKTLKNSEYNLADYNIYFTSSSGYKFNYTSGNMSIDFWFYPESRDGNDGKYCSRTLLSIQQGDAIPGTGLSNADGVYYAISSLDIFLSYRDYYIISTGNYGIRGNLPDGKLGVYAFVYTPEIASNIVSVPTPERYKTMFKVGEVDEGKWSHFYINRKDGKVKSAVNGIFSTGNIASRAFLTNPFISIGSRLDNQISTYNASIIENYFKSGIFYSVPSLYSSQYKYLDFGKEQDSTNVYFDNIRLCNIDLWNGDFNPETEAIETIGKQIFVYDSYAYYVDPITNNVVKLSFAKWDDISESDKLILLDKVAWNDLPDVDQIKLIQTDPSKDIVCYNYQTDTAKPTIKIEKIDSSASAIVYPTKFLYYGAIQDYIKNIKATGSTNATSNIRLAITRDGETYYTYNATNVAWVPLDNRSDVRTSGILLDSLDDIPASSWKQFGLDKFAFSISLIKMNENDPCQINDITLSISLDEKWVKANKSTQVKYKYVGPTLLKVNLLEEGKYRINYNDRG